MIGFTYALICACLFALVSGLQKKLVLSRNEYIVVWAFFGFSLPILLTALFFSVLPQIDTTFIYAISITVALNTLANILLFKAYKISDLSLTIPFLSFTPVFLLLTSFIILGEFPNFWGLLGIILTVLGALFLHFHKFQQGWKEPFKAILYERGSIYMLGVAFIWSITSPYDKVAILHSSPIFYPLTSYFLLFLVFTVIVLTKFKEEAKKTMTKSWPKFLIIASIGGLAILFQMAAFSKILVAYVSVIKRGGMLLGSVFLGYYFFKEKEMKSRLLGALVILIGMLMIIFLN